MSRFCGGTGSVPAFTDQEINARFTDGIMPEGLPPMPNGLADQAWISTYVQRLQNDLGKLPQPPRLSEMQSAPFNSPDAKAPLDDFVKKENALYESIKQEYCFYESRYFSALDRFLSTLANNSLRSEPDTAVQARLNTTLVLNQKVTLMTQLTNGIAQFRYQQAANYNPEINKINSKLQTRQKTLIEQRDILTRETAAADLHKRMVEYTTEKNRANQNLLSLYGILNITAIAMIFYIART
jgi:hypothetical protein